MRSRARKLLLVAGATIVAIVAALPLVLWLLLDAQIVRAQATRYIKEKTGRELKLNGPIGLSFYPFLGAKLQDVSLGYPGETGGGTFARFESVDLKVRLLPLMRRVIEVAGIRARGGAVSVPGYELREVGVTTGAFGDARETDVSLEFDLHRQGGTGLATRIESPMVFNIPAQHLELRDISGRLGEMSFTAALTGRGVFDTPAFEGRIQTASFNLRRMLAQVGMAYTPADPKALTAASLAARIASSPNQIAVTDLLLSLDGSTFKGRATGVTRSHEAPTSWDAELTVDRLDIDRYVPGVAAPDAGATEGEPYAALRELVARARLQVESLRAFGLQLTGVRASLDARNGVVTVAPVRAGLYEGSGEFSGRLDVRARVPAYHVEGRVARVSVQPLLSDAREITALSGTGDLSVRLDASAQDPARLIEASRGVVSLSVRDGRIEGADFLKLLAQAREAADRLRGRPVSAPSDPADRTKFSRFAASAEIVNGVARSDDLTLEAPDLRASGSGTVDLVRERIDYVVRARSDEAGNVLVPIAIEGSFDSPTYNVQAGALLRDAAREELKKQLEKRLRGLIRRP